ncbi:hypothetical protein BDI4_670033 [Burkholderia diffusa]|nr:hypothetical protein BDI4_670033 [Burkholderia diffusa]
MRVSVMKLIRAFFTRTAMTVPERVSFGGIEARRLVFSARSYRRVMQLLHRLTTRISLDGDFLAEYDASRSRRFTRTHAPMPCMQ